MITRGAVPNANRGGPVGGCGLPARAVVRVGGRAGRRYPRAMNRPTLAVLFGCTLLGACSMGEGLYTVLPRPVAARERAVVRPRPPQPEPLAGAERAGSLALQTALPIEPSFQELLLLPGDTAAAVAYQFDLEAGEQLEVEVRAEADASPAAVEIFQHLGGTVYRYALNRPSGEPFRFDPVVTGRYLLRVRPDAGGGRYRISVRGPAGSVRFPVANADLGAIRSPYGADRDAGVRSHEGVDIFAPRGTPVISVADAVVERVEHTRVGGRVIWARDVARDLTYYYAHLEKQLVSRGQRISAGDTIGEVGNSGNASRASTHLHFGVYRPGVIAMNPLPLLGRPDGELVAQADTAVLGSRAETRGSAVRLRAGPAQGSPVVAELPAGTALRITGVLGQWRRVSLEDGRAGFIAGWLLQPAS